MFHRLNIRLLVVLLGVIALTRPLAARIAVECADGTPCSAAVLQEQRGCCGPQPCDEHPAPPPDDRCVIKVTVPPDLTVPPATTALEFLPVAVPDTSTVTPPLTPTGTLSEREVSPTPSVLLVRCHGPRAPPRDSA